MHPRRPAFTLIELLIVIAIIAVLSVVVLLALNPVELLKQARDSTRLSDMDTLTKALSLTQLDNLSLGTANTVYVSLPDPAATSTLGTNCGTMGLPALPTSYTYHCAASSTLRKNDGTGWLPVNLTQLSAGTPLTSLPIDSVNTSSSRLYYAYATNGNQYEVTTPLESQNYKLGGGKDVIAGDGGTKVSLYERGTNLSLEPLDYGDSSLVGLWTFDEGSSSVAYDYSGNNATGSWSGTGTHYAGGRVGTWAGQFNGSDDYVHSATSLSAATQETVTAWFETPSSGNRLELVNLKWGNNAGLFVESNQYLTFMADPGNTFSGTVVVSTSSWHFGAAVISGNTVTVYLDNISRTGSITGSITTGSPVIGSRGGSYPFSGLIDDVRIYNRALSAAEVAALYNGGK